MWEREGEERLAPYLPYIKELYSRNTQGIGEEERQARTQGSVRRGLEGVKSGFQGIYRGAFQRVKGLIWVESY